MMKKNLPIIKGQAYLAHIKNFNHNSLKQRPIIILKTSTQKVLALQLTTSRLFSNPQTKEIDTEVLNWFKENKIKGYSFGTSHWIYKKKITNVFLQNNKKVLASNQIKYKLFNLLKKIRNKQIRDKEAKIVKYLKIYLKTKIMKNEYFKMAHNELKWIIKHNINFKNKYSKIRDQKKYLKKLINELKDC